MSEANPLESLLVDRKEQYEESDRPRSQWYLKNPTEKMQDVAIQSENPVATIMDHEDKGNGIKYTLWTMTNDEITVTFEYPRVMEGSDLVAFLDLAGIPRTDPTDYSDTTTVPVLWEENKFGESRWAIDYDCKQSTRWVDRFVPDIDGSLINRIAGRHRMTILWMIVFGTLHLIATIETGVSDGGSSTLEPISAFVFFGITILGTASEVDSDFRATTREGKIAKYTMIASSALSMMYFVLV